VTQNRELVRYFACVKIEIDFINKKNRIV